MLAWAGFRAPRQLPGNELRDLNLFVGVYKPLVNSPGVYPRFITYDLPNTQFHCFNRCYLHLISSLVLLLWTSKPRFESSCRSSFNSSFLYLPSQNVITFHRGLKFSVFCFLLEDRFYIYACPISAIKCLLARQKLEHPFESSFERERASSADSLLGFSCPVT